METFMNTERRALKTENQFSTQQGFAGVDGRFAASSPPRFASIGRAIYLSRDARIYMQTATPPSRNPMKNPG
jgi:hypothetical protein